VTLIAAGALAAAAPAPSLVAAGSLAALDATARPKAARKRPNRTLLGRKASARVLARAARRPPVRLYVPALRLRAGVTPARVRGRSRTLALPADARRVAWYRHGARPGDRGTALFAAHADFNGAPGAFRRLAALAIGARITVRLRRGGVRHFRAVARRRYEKDRLPSRLFRWSGPRVLALVTCGGSFDDTTRTYDSNTVVYAIPA
jgi:Sortase domain